MALILALATYLRFTNLADNPGWYTDEATHVDIARHLLRGEIRYMAINQSTLLFARPPLFHLLLSLLFRWLGEGLLTLRLLTAALGVASVGLLYVTARRSQGDRVFALLAALLLGIYPQAVLYSRFGFSYNLLVPLVLLSLLGLGEYLRSGGRGWLALAALALGTGAVCDLMIVTLTPVLVLAILWKRWRDLIWNLPLLALPFGLYTALMLIHAPEAFLFDFGFTASRLSALSPFSQLANIALNYTTLISQDFWMLAGVIGLFMLRPARLRALCGLLLFVPLLIMGRSVALYSLSAYYMIPLMPFVALGVAALLRYGVPRLWGIIHDGVAAAAYVREVPANAGRWLAGSAAALVLLLVVISPLVTSLALTLENVRGRYATAIDPFLINAEDARSVAAYVNARVAPDDLVIITPPVGWQINARIADFQMSVAYHGEDTPHLPGSTPHERYLFDPTYTRARYVIVDNLWRNWGAVIIPGGLRMLLDVETWPLVYASGSIQVFENPQQSVDPESAARG